jgi:hypothetical protein
VQPFILLNGSAAAPQKFSISRSVEQAKEIGTRIIPRPGISACDDSVADHFHYLAADHVGSRRCKVDAGFSEKPHAPGKDLERGGDSIRIALQVRQFSAIRLPQESAPAVLMRRKSPFPSSQLPMQQEAPGVASPPHPRYRPPPIGLGSCGGPRTRPKNN